MSESGQKSCIIMALLDGGTLKRHKSWLRVKRFLTLAEISLHIILTMNYSWSDLCGKPFCGLACYFN